MIICQFNSELTFNGLICQGNGLSHAHNSVLWVFMLQLLRAAKTDFLTH